MNRAYKQQSYTFRNLPEIRIITIHKGRNLYEGGFVEGELGYQTLFQDSFDSSLQAANFVKEILIEDFESMDAE